MNTDHRCLSEIDFANLSSESLSDDQARQYENHLTDCKQCRDRLDQLDDHGSSPWRSELRPILLETFQDETHPDGAAPTPAECDPGFLDLLGPTDHAGMLGRVGNYEVVGMIGHGGMGVVFKAFDAALNRFVAIKMLLPQLSANGTARQRFLREAQAAAAVVDDHVMPIFGVDQWQGIPYLVMKYSSGQTLGRRIETEGPLNLKEILRVALHVSKGLAAAHAQGLVHRDVKPSNIILDGTVNRAVLMDFGLARAVDDVSVTRTGIICGTPLYMSPEQVRGDSIDTRSDLFSLGSTLYAMCTGRAPFRSQSPYRVMHQIASEEPLPIGELNSEIPRWLGGIIACLMSKQVDERIQSAAEVVELLESCLQHIQDPNSTPLPPSAKAFESSESPRRIRSRRKRLLTFAGGGLICLAVLLGAAHALTAMNVGQLAIECDSNDVPIRIMQGDREVRKLTVSRDGTTIRVAAGKYRVKIGGGIESFVIENQAVTLARGGKAVVKIRVKEPTGQEVGEMLHEAVAALAPMTDVNVEPVPELGAIILRGPRKGVAAAKDAIQEVEDNLGVANSVEVKMDSPGTKSTFTGDSRPNVGTTRPQHDSLALVLLMHPTGLPNGNLIQRDITKQVISSMRPGDQLGHLAYSGSRPKWLWGEENGLATIGKSPSRRKLMDIASTAVAGDMPRFADAWQMAVKALQSTNSKERRLIILTDGTPAIGDASILEQFRDNGIKVDSVLTIPGHVPDPRKVVTDHGIDLLVRLPELTGGSFFLSRPEESRKSLPDFYRSHVAMLATKKSSEHKSPKSED